MVLFLSYLLRDKWSACLLLFLGAELVWCGGDAVAGTRAHLQGSVCPRLPGEPLQREEDRAHDLGDVLWREQDGGFFLQKA